MLAQVAHAGQEHDRAALRLELDEPSRCSIASASRTGVVLTPSRWAISTCRSRLPGARSPARISAFRRSATWPAIVRGAVSVIARKY